MNIRLIENVNEKYDDQIDSSFGVIKKLNESNKELFNYSLKLNLNDWREIRKGNFWDELDNLKNNTWLNKFDTQKEFIKNAALDFLKNRYTIRAIKKYLKR